MLADPEEILEELPQLGEEADFVIADGPGSNTETTRSLLMRADLALVPAKASMLEVRVLCPSHQSAPPGPVSPQGPAAGRLSS